MHPEGGELFSQALQLLLQLLCKLAAASAANAHFPCAKNSDKMDSPSKFPLPQILPSNIPSRERGS